MPTPRLLLIDDEPELGRLLQDCLDVGDCHLDYTTDPHEGLRLAMTRLPDVILLDIDMPELNGLEILTQLKHMRSTSTIPVMMLTARTETEVVEQVMQRGAQGYLLKPFRVTTLLERLNSLLNLQLSPAAPRPAHQPPLAGQATVLVIDDDANICKIVAELIGDCGHHALVAQDGASGLQLAREAQPELILLDLQMPGQSGFEVLEDLRSTPATAHTRVVILSGESDAASVQRAHALGIRGYLLKPFSLVNLAQLLEQQLGG